MTFFPDVNVWLALVVPGRIHSRQTQDWAAHATGDWIVLNRITQMGLLRLLTNPSAMGRDALTGAQAWLIADGLLEHENIRFIKEPDRLEHNWRNLTPRAASIPTSGPMPTSLPSLALRASLWSHSTTASRSIVTFR